MTSPVAGHERLYRSLLHAYPAGFRSEYGEQMVQLFGDQLRRDGTVRAWSRAVAEIPATASTEHLRRNRDVAHSLTVAPTPVSRLLGLLGVIGGGILLVGFLPLFVPDFTVSSDNFNLRLTLFNLGAIAIAIAAYRRHAVVSRRLALAGSLPVIVANAAYLLFTTILVAKPGDLGPGDYQPIVLFSITASAMWLSDAWFGLVTFRLGVLNRLSALALILGSIAAFVGQGYFGVVRSGTLLETLVLAGVALQGVAWMLLGIDVALRRTKPAAQVAESD